MALVIDYDNQSHFYQNFVYHYIYAKVNFIRKINPYKNTYYYKTFDILNSYINELIS